MKVPISLKPYNPPTGPAIEVGEYTVVKHPPIPLTDQVNVIWIENKIGEGMSVDLDKLWEEWF